MNLRGSGNLNHAGTDMDYDYETHRSGAQRMTSSLVFRHWTAGIDELSQPLEEPFGDLDCPADFAIDHASAHASDDRSSSVGHGDS